MYEWFSSRCRSDRDALSARKDLRSPQCQKCSMPAPALVNEIASGHPGSMDRRGHLKHPLRQPCAGPGSALGPDVHVVFMEGARGLPTKAGPGADTQPHKVDKPGKRLPDPQGAREGSRRKIETTTRSSVDHLSSPGRGPAAVAASARRSGGQMGTIGVRQLGQAGPSRGSIAPAWQQVL